MIVYSFKFHAIQARHHYKFFSNPPFLGKVNNNILVMVGNNLAVLPYELNSAFLSSAIDVESPPPNKQANLQDWINGDEQEIAIENDTTDFCSPPLESIKALMDKKGFPHSRYCILRKNISVIRIVRHDLSANWRRKCKLWGMIY